MNILIVTSYFYPENFRINDLAIELNNSGHEITVLTSIPNYPKGKFYKGYGLVDKRNETYKGINIHRCITWPRGNASNINLILNYLSYVFFASLSILKFREKDFDLIFVYEPSPITVCLPAILLKKIKKLPIYFWVLDLWPESLLSSQKVKTSLIPRMLLPLVKYIYKNCDCILVSSKAFINSITNKSISKSKIVYFPQWAETLFKPLDYNPESDQRLIPEGFNIMFAGNIGTGQDFDSVLEAAKILNKNPNIKWSIIGHGSQFDRVNNKIIEDGLSNNVHLLGEFSIDKMPMYYAQADVMLLSLSKKEIYSLTIPAKLQSYMACGKPILSMVDGETSKIIKDASAGLICGAENPECLANNVLQLYNMEKSDLLIMGNNARQYYEKFFDRSMLLERLKKILNEIYFNNDK